MRRLWAIAPVLALAAACTSSDGGTTSSDPPSPTDPATTSTSAMPTSVPLSSPSTPATPTVPADVPTTGPNTKPGEKPPVMPVVATQHTAAGAKAFAEFFMLTLDWAYATMSGTYMRMYSAAGCVICDSIADEIDGARKKGHRYIGGRTTRVASRAGTSGALTSQIVRIDTTSFEEVTSAGGFVTGDPAYTNQDWALNIRWTGGRWTVTRIAVVQ